MAAPELPNPRNIVLPRPDSIKDPELKRYLEELVRKLENAYTATFDNTDAVRNAIT